MKKFDIDKLERKMPYSVPDDFFSEVQNHVLSQTVHKIGSQPNEKTSSSRGLRFKLNWAYSAAAVLVAVFGIVFFMKNSESTSAVTTQTMATTIVDSAKETITKSNSTLAIQSTKPVEKSEKEVKKVYDDYKSTELTKTEKVIASNTKTTKASRTTVANKVNSTNAQVTSTEAKVQTASVKTDAKVDQILEVFSDSELAELSQNTENDVYLDLYY